MICLVVASFLIVTNASGFTGVGWGEATAMALPEVL